MLKPPHAKNSRKWPKIAENGPPPKWPRSVSSPLKSELRNVATSRRPFSPRGHGLTALHLKNSQRLAPPKWPRSVSSPLKSELRNVATSRRRNTGARDGLKKDPRRGRYFARRHTGGNDGIVMIAPFLGACVYHKDTNSYDSSSSRHIACIASLSTSNFLCSSSLGSAVRMPTPVLMLCATCSEAYP